MAEPEVGDSVGAAALKVIANLRNAADKMETFTPKAAEHGFSAGWLWYVDLYRSTDETVSVTCRTVRDPFQASLSASLEFRTDGGRARLVGMNWSRKEARP